MALKNEDFWGFFFCVFAVFYSFFRKNDDKLACVFEVRAYLIDFGSRGENMVWNGHISHWGGEILNHEGTKQHEGTPAAWGC